MIAVSETFEGVNHAIGIQSMIAVSETFEGVNHAIKHAARSAWNRSGGPILTSGSAAPGQSTHQIRPAHLRTLSQ
jgi:hypothetical protein